MLLNAAPSPEADSMQTLNERISQLRDEGSNASSSSSTSSSSRDAGSSAGSSVATLDPGSALGPAERSFSEVGDADIAEALASRLRGAGLVTADSSEENAAEQSKPLTGEVSPAACGSGAWHCLADVVAVGQHCHALFKSHAFCMAQPRVCQRAQVSMAWCQTHGCGALHLCT